MARLALPQRERHLFAAADILRRESQTARPEILRGRVRVFLDTKLRK